MSEQTSQPVRPWRSQIAAIVRHARLPLVLVSDDKLPVWEFEPLVFTSDAQRLAAELFALTGCEGVLLGSAWGVYQPAERVLRAAAVLVLRDEDWAPPGGMRWTRELDSQALPWPDGSLHSAVAALLAQPAGADAPLRPPWSRPGFFEQAGTWMRETLSGTPWQLEAPVQQFRNWGISCVLRAPTARGDVYFKVAGGSDLFADEPAVMQALGQSYPDLVPSPLAREPEQRWMLLADLGQPLRQNPDRELRIGAMTAHGRMQVALAGQVEQLLADGLHDRQLATLPAQIEALLTDQNVKTVLGVELHARLAAAAPALYRLCEQLAAYSVPPTVVHGDLHEGNIAVRDGRLQVFDWTDACVAHPFFDLVTLLPSREQPAGAALAERMLSEYLRLWERYETAERLREAWRLASIAGSLHQLVSYRHIVAGLEPLSRWENADGLIEFAQQLLGELDVLEDNAG